MKRIILTGGGTAGHVTPNIALLPRLKELGYDIHYIGSYEGIEKKLIEENEKLKKRNVVTLIVMHGSKTAQSIVEVVKLLMPVQNIEAFDLSLEDDPKESYEQLKNKIIEINQGRGILALYDMGSIQVMLDSIME